MMPAVGHRLQLHAVGVGEREDVDGLAVERSARFDAGHGRAFGGRAAPARRGHGSERSRRRLIHGTASFIEELPKSSAGIVSDYRTRSADHVIFCRHRAMPGLEFQHVSQVVRRRPGAARRVVRRRPRARRTPSSARTAPESPRCSRCSPASCRRDRGEVHWRGRAARTSAARATRSSAASAWSTRRCSASRTSRSPATSSRAASSRGFGRLRHAEMRERTQGDPRRAAPGGLARRAGRFAVGRRTASCSRSRARSPSSAGSSSSTSRRRR